VEFVILQIDVHIERKPWLAWNIDRGVDVRMVLVDFNSKARKGSPDAVHRLVEPFYVYPQRHAA